MQCVVVWPWAANPFQTVSCLDLLETHLIRCFHQTELNYSDRLRPFANDDHSAHKNKDEDEAYMLDPLTTQSIGAGSSGVVEETARQPPLDFLEYWKSGTREIRTFRGHSHGVWTVAISPNHSMLASAGVDRLIRLWDIETGRLLRSLRGHTHDIRAALFTPDGQTLITGSEDRTIRMWNPRTGEPTK